ncbi:MAG: putative nucleotidyltransferase substrate binding domain-containing protein [Rhodospirillales bacterium]|nr:putative nucleotidyltransferase substrate binding domain-containing protein [Rhodospirillales bacterium]
MQSQTAIFSKLVKDFMRRVPLAVETGVPCARLIERLAAEDASSATVTDGQGRPLGIITEQDITRRVALRALPETPVEDVMTAPVMTIPADEYLYFAIARMRRHGLRHMPVVDAGGGLVGMLDLHDALAVAAERLVGQIDILTRDDSLDGLKQIKAAQVELAAQLLEDNLPAPEIQALLTHVNRDIYRRLVDLSLLAMEAEGHGPPPVGFCVVVMGSGGRGENFLYPDQDNGFILGDYPDDRHTEIDSWFIELAERLTGDLDAVGIPLCHGHVMATNPLWRKTLTQWKEQIALWSRKRNPTALRLCDIFFDFRSAWGDAAMAEELRAVVTRVTSANPVFLRDMYADDAEHGVALGFFRRFITERKDKEHKGKINLKHTGTLPLVESVRLLALSEGVENLSTLGRMRVLHESGFLGVDEYDYLFGAYTLITRLLLRQQVADFKAGVPVSNYVDPKFLTERERDMLVDSFKAIRALRGRVKDEFSVEVLGTP